MDEAVDEIKSTVAKASTSELGDPVRTALRAHSVLRAQIVTGAAEAA